MDSYTVIKFVSEAFSNPEWRNVMQEALMALKQNET